MFKRAFAPNTLYLVSVLYVCPQPGSTLLSGLKFTLLRRLMNGAYVYEYVCNVWTLTSKSLRPRAATLVV
jgi:hypothetical protein